MAVHRIAQVGGDSLAKPADHVKTGCRKHAKRHRHSKQRSKMLPQCHHLRAAVNLHQSAINQAAQRQGKGESCQGGHHQKKAGQGN